jgi:hypothetical protein
MTRRRVKRPQPELAVRNGDPGPTAYDELIVYALESWARDGKKPKNPKRFDISPEVADTVMEYLSAKAMAVQNKALDQALKRDASHPEMDAGITVSRNVLDRRFGKPVERTAVVGKVQVIFDGLHPELLPSGPPEDKAEIVEIDGDFGTDPDDAGNG